MLFGHHSGSGTHHQLFVKHPMIRRAHERALAATWPVYQAVGAVELDDERAGG